MSTPTPRTSSAIIASGFQAVPEGFRAFAGILERELAALTAERDQLRAEVKSCGELSCDECNARTAALMAERDQLRAALALGQQNCDDAYDDLRAERDAAKARAERAEADAERYRLVTLRQDAELAAELERAAHYRDQWQRVASELTTLTTERDAAKARAARAEDNLAALEQCHDDNCRGVVQIAAELAKERARLDSGQILLTVAGERVWHCGVDLRAAIDAGMREGAK